MAFSNLTPTSTFAQWYTQTNEISTFLDTQIVANSQWAYGAFKIGANSSLNISNSVFANDSLFKVLCNTEVGNSSTGYVQFLGDAFTVASNTVLLNPITSVFVNSAITVNGVSSFLGLATIANAFISNLATVAIRSDGPITANNGTLVARQLSFTTNGATTNSTLSAAGYADHTFTGLENATIWNALPTQDTVLSGIDAHTAVTSSVDGARILFLQNLSTTYKITLSCANASSTAAHRLESIRNLSVVVEPRSSVLLVYAKDTLRWRVIGGSHPIGGLLAAGNTTITGTLAVSGNATFSSNVAADPFYVNTVTGRVGIGTASPSSKFHSIGPNLLEDITTTDQLVVTNRLTPLTDATQTFGAAFRRWSTPFFSVADGSADGTMLQAVVTGTTGELKYLTGYTGTKVITTSAGAQTFTWKAGILMSVS